MQSEGDQTGSDQCQGADLLDMRDWFSMLDGRPGSNGLMRTQVEVMGYPENNERNQGHYQKPRDRLLTHKASLKTPPIQI